MRYGQWGRYVCFEACSEQVSTEEVLDPVL